MFVTRRTLYCAVGHAGPVVELMKRLTEILAEVDDSLRARRVYTDLSGATDRVIIEEERETLHPPREVSARIHANPQAQEIFREAHQHLVRAENEFLMLESSG